MTVSRVDDLLTPTVWSFVALVASGRARLAGRDSHPLEIADFHGVKDCWDTRETIGLM